MKTQEKASYQPRHRGNPNMLKTLMGSLDFHPHHDSPQDPFPSKGPDHLYLSIAGVTEVIRRYDKSRQYDEDDTPHKLALAEKAISLYGGVAAPTLKAAVQDMQEDPSLSFDDALDARNKAARHDGEPKQISALAAPVSRSDYHSVAPEPVGWSKSGTNYMPPDNHEAPNIALGTAPEPGQRSVVQPDVSRR